MTLKCACARTHGRPRGLCRAQHIYSSPPVFSRVFDARSIDKWHKAGSKCPMCNTALPKKLLKLFFEPQQACVGAVPSESIKDSNEATGKGSVLSKLPTSAEVTQLRRELASSNKV